MYRIAGSAIAWATRSRSNGSPWISGRSATRAAVADVTGSSPKPRSSAFFGDCVRISVEFGSAQRGLDRDLPDAAALNKTSFSGSRIAVERRCVETFRLRNGPEKNVRVEQKPHQHPSSNMAQISSS